MELSLFSYDLKTEHKDCNTSLTRFEKFRPEVQAAIRAVGTAMFRSDGSHNAIYPPKPRVSEPLTLTTANYWQELDTLGKEGRLPEELASALKGILGCYLSDCIMPVATPNVIELVCKHLSGGILLQSSATETLLAVAVFIPDLENAERLRTFFQLVPVYPGGNIRICE